jgi:hypothetical protein
MSSSRVAVRCALLAIFLSAGFAATDPVYKSMRDAALGDSLVVENIVLKRDAGTITLKSGALAFTAPAMGRDTMAVFVGEGEFTFTPLSPIDRNYMVSLTGHDTVSEQFDRALFCFTDDTGKEIRASAKTPSNDPKLADVLRDYRKKLRSRLESPRSLLEYLLTDVAMDNLEADVLTDLYNPHAAGFFSAYFHGRKHSDLRFHVRPRGAFPELATPEEVAVINLDPEATQEGIWYLSHLGREMNAHTASSDENNRIVQADHYKIDTTIAKNDHFTASTEMQFHAVTDGDRVIKFSLVPNLRVGRVSTAGRTWLSFRKRRKKTPVFLW